MFPTNFAVSSAATSTTDVWRDTLLDVTLDR
jgi:hypothetical protein